MQNSSKGCRGSMKFTIQGASHIQEYLQHRPASLLSVSATPKDMSAIRKLTPPKIHLSTSRKTTCAQIHLTPLHESELLLFAKRNKLGNTLLALDHLLDPHNLGAIARSAAFFGIKGIIVAKRRQVLLTDVSVNVARGGFALLDLFIVNNLAQVMLKLKERGFWLLGADMQGDLLRTRQFDKQIFLLGAEGEGLSPLLRKQCDCLVKIPSAHGSAPQSLNVSVAAGILLYTHMDCR